LNSNNLNKNPIKLILDQMHQILKEEE